MLNKIPLFETMDIAIEAAAEHLPEGFRVIISVEKNGYGVYLEDKSGAEIDIDGGDGMRSDVWEAIDQAKIIKVGV
tara:strand:- start:51 stop:278 length:228 start_codon:yes stop_codon:yes gene_type:complete